MLVCTTLRGCVINKTYDNKTDEVEILLKICKKQHAEQEAPSKAKPTFQMQWKGTQKQLAELFVELKRKGWIEEFNYDAIKAAFTNSNTIHQVLKPGTDRKTKKEEYDQIYTSNYSPSFFGIMLNKK